ncbi:hypothetical protein [Spiroplasma eriocheiris]|uniref:Transmembrane protein n=1 Tax=Spiroplasma eriocheiris TaxID=315358 RepID=A0A0H3XIC0_9MOLU|nr:hypothetical protein [Spiroplasma eriocheiris]AHF57755.1 putative transmembrane protein [Spiroplasma eriocheiris CCTCC M 207170]AKM54205.1 hypothetical protein SERIO_v1c06350 [Spiroplasma eriocheiris]
MELHIILVFTLILALALYVFNFLFMMQYHRQRDVKDYRQEFRWTAMLRFIFIFIYAVLTPVIIFIIVDYILLLTIPNIAPIFSYLYVIIGLIDYGLILVYLIIQTQCLNSLWIKVNDNAIFFLDEEVPLTAIVGIAVKGITKKLIYNVDGETDKKTIIGKKTFSFLQAIKTPNNE